MNQSEQLPNNRLQRIGVIGDIHCEDWLLEASLQFLSSQHLDLICTVGDIVDGYGDVNRTIELLKTHQVIGVRGNHERWLINDEMRELEGANPRQTIAPATWQFLHELPLTQSFETVAGRMMLCHGLGQFDMGGIRPDDDSAAIESNIVLWQLVDSGEYRFVVNGHTHRRLVRRFDHLTIINAGTLHRKYNPCFCAADFEAGFVQFFNLDDDGKIMRAERFELPVA